MNLVRNAQLLQLRYNQGQQHKLSWQKLVAAESNVHVNVSITIVTQCHILGPFSIIIPSNDAESFNILKEHNL